MGLEGHEVTHARGPKRRQQAHIGDRPLCQRPWRDLERAGQSGVDQVIDGQSVRQREELTIGDHPTGAPAGDLGGGKLHETAPIASAIRLCEVCAVRPPSTTISAPFR
jgi:hypothetical protein